MKKDTGHVGPLPDDFDYLRKLLNMNKPKDFNFLIGPGDDDYGRKKPFWKIKEEIIETIKKEQSKVEMDKCIFCDKETQYPKNTHIDYRYNYVEGSGQLCKECADRIYKNPLRDQTPPF